MRDIKTLDTVELPIQDLDTSLVESVRQPDMYRVRSIAEAYHDNPDSVPPISVLSDRRTVVDGMHRVTALRRYRTYYPDAKPLDTVFAEVLDVDPGDASKWLLVVELNSPSAYLPLQAPQAIMCLRNYLSEVKDHITDEELEHLRNWCRGHGIPTEAVYEVLSALGLRKKKGRAQGGPKIEPQIEAPSRRVPSEARSNVVPLITTPPPVAAAPSVDTDLRASLCVSLLRNLSDTIRQMGLDAAKVAHAMVMQAKSSGEYSALVDAAKVVHGVLTVMFDVLRQGANADPTLPDVRDVS